MRHVMLCVAKNQIFPSVESLQTRETLENSYCSECCVFVIFFLHFFFYVLQ